MNTRYLPFALAACTWELVSGCTAKGPGVDYVEIRRGELATAGAEIAASDGSFVIRSGAPFVPPFQARCDFDPTHDPPRIFANVILESYAVAERYGARRVSVRVAAREQPLHGVLWLCSPPSTAMGPGARSYRIEVPEEKIVEATGGRIAVVYEEVPLQGGGDWVYGWVLWISDAPFPSPM